MIDLKINGEKNKVQSFDEITTEQCIRVSEEGEFNLIKYLAIVLDKDYENVFSSYINDSPKLYKMLGLPKDPRKKPKPHKIELPEEIEGLELVYDCEAYEVGNIGQRYMIEQRTLTEKKEYNFLVFVLAVCLSGEHDINKVTKLYDQLMKSNYYTVLNSGAFFLRSFQSGRRKEQRFLKSVLKMLRMSN